MRISIRTAVVFVLGISLLAPLGVASAQAAASKPGLSCSSSSLGITPLHTPTFFEDKSAGYLSQWIGYRINSTDVQATLSTPANSRLVSRSTNLVTTVAPGTNYSVTYALLEDTGRGAGLTHNITFTSGATSVNCSFTFKSVIDAQAEGSSIVERAAPANVSYRSATPVIYSGEQGNLISMTVDGKAGLLEQGSLVSLSPTPKVTWDSSIDLQLVSVRWRAGSDETMKRDQLWYAATDTKGDGVIANSNYHVEYTFRVNVGASASWQLTPAVYVRDSISTIRSTSGPSAQFSVIDRPNSDFYTAVNHTFTGVMTVGGGTAPYKWTLKSGTLPEGLKLSEQGQITGVPTKIENQAVEFSVTSASTPNPTVIPIRFFIQDAAVTTNLPRTVSIHKPMGTYSFKIAGVKSNSGWGFSGTIPPGTIFGNGTLSGTPTLAGKYTFTLSFGGESDEDNGKNSNGNGKPARKVKGERTYTIEVTEHSDYSPSSLSDAPNLSLGYGSPNTAVTATDFGYATLYQNETNCARSGANTNLLNPVYSNTKPLDTSTATYSTANDPYFAELNSGFCIQVDVVVDPSSLNTSVRVQDVRVRFDFSEYAGLDANNVESFTARTLELNGEKIISFDASKLTRTDTTAPNVAPCANFVPTGNYQQMEYCLGDLTTTSGGKISILLPLIARNFNPSVYKPIRIHIQVTSLTPEWDNANNGDAGQNNGCGNGDQASPGGSGPNNNAENSGGKYTYYGNCPDKFTANGATKKLTSVASKSVKSSASQSASKAKYSTTSGEDDEEESKPESGFCYNGTFRNNGWGNGDQSAPGGSGPNNNAENNTSGKISPSGSPATKSGSSTDDGSGSDDGTESERYCDPAPTDYDNIAILWLMQKPSTDNAPLDKPSIKLRDPNSDTSTVKSDVTFPSGFYPLPNAHFYAVTCYSKEPVYDIRLSASDSTTATLPSRVSPEVICKVAQVANTNPASSQMEFRGVATEFVVSIPKPTATCENLKYYVSTYLFETTDSPTPTVNFTRADLVNPSGKDKLIDLDNVQNMWSMDIQLSDLSSCKPNISLDKKPNDDNRDITSEITLPESTPGNYFAVICYRAKDSYIVGSNVASDGTNGVICKIAKDSVSNSSLLTKSNAGTTTVSIPSPLPQVCRDVTYWTSTYLYKSGTSPLPIALDTITAQGITDRSDSLTALDPSAGVIAAESVISRTGTTDDCAPYIKLKKPNPYDSGKVKSEVTFPSGSYDSNKRYFAVTCFRLIETYTVTNSLPLQNNINCKVAAQISNGSGSLKDSTQVSVPAPAPLLCKDSDYYVSTYLYMIPGSKTEPDAGHTITNGEISTLLIGAEPSDGLISQDPNYGELAWDMILAATGKRNPSCGPTIELQQLPNNGSDPLKSKITFPTDSRNGDRYFAVICFREDLSYPITNAIAIATGQSPAINCKVASLPNGSAEIISAPSGEVDVVIPNPGSRFCQNRYFFVSTYLIATPLSVPETWTPFNLLRSGETLTDTSPESSVETLTVYARPMIIEKSRSDAACTPSIKLESPKPNVENDKIKSIVTIPTELLHPTYNYFPVTCYNSIRYSMNGTTSTSDFPSSTCSVAGTSGEKVKFTKNDAGVTNVTIPSPLGDNCSATDYWVSTYLIERNGEVTYTRGTTYAALISGDKKISWDPASGYAVKITIDATNVNPAACKTGGGTGGTQIDLPDNNPVQPPLPAPTPTTPTNVIPPYTPIAQCATGSFCTPVSPARVATFPVVTGNQGRFVASAGLVMRPPGIPEGYTLAFPNSSIPEFKGKALFSLTPDGSGVVVTSDTGWTGFLHINGIAVAPTTGGAKLKASTAEGAYLRATGGAKATAGAPAGFNFALDIQIYPDPSPKSSYVNTADGKSLVTWEKSPTPTTVGYEVYFNGVLSCTTKTTSCTVAKLVGPKSKLAIVAIGGKKTRSVETMPSFKAGKFAVALVVFYDTSKAILKSADVTALNKLITFIKKEGYKQVFVVGHTDVRLRKVNNALSKARAQAVIAYMAPRLKGVTYSGTADADRVPFVKGNSKKALAMNRRAEIFVR